MISVKYILNELYKDFQSAKIKNQKDLNIINFAEMCMRNKVTKYISIGLTTACLTGALIIGNIPPSLGQIVQQEQKTNQAQTIDNKVAVLLIDMQEIYLTNVSDEEKKREIPYQLEVLDYCKKNNLPVFVLEFAGFGDTIPILKDKIDSSDKKSYIIKTCRNGFHETSLDEQLKSENIKHLLLMGLYASACVRSTAENALDRGYNILTSKDLIADENSDSYDPESTVLESRWWYKEKGIYRESYKDLLKIISEGTIEENLPQNEYECKN